MQSGSFFPSWDLVLFAFSYPQIINPFPGQQTFRRRRGKHEKTSLCHYANRNVLHLPFPILLNLNLEIFHDQSRNPVHPGSPVKKRKCVKKSGNIPVPASSPVKIPDRSHRVNRSKVLQRPFADLRPVGMSKTRIKVPFQIVAALFDRFSDLFCDINSSDLVCMKLINSYSRPTRTLKPDLTSLLEATPDRANANPLREPCQKNHPIGLP